MAIWLRKEGSAVGIDGDVIRREELASLTEIDRGFIDMQQHAARMVSEARARAEIIVAEAEEKASAIFDAAEKKFENCARLGYAAGKQNAVAEVHAAMLDRSLQDKRALGAMQERIGGLVLRAVEQIIDGDRAALFKRAAAILGRELADASFLTVTVNPSDAQTVRSVFREIGEEMSWPIQANVVEDNGTSQGHCLCEWDYGVLDASLKTQLKSLRSSIRKAIQDEDPPDVQVESESHAAASAHSLDQNAEFEADEEGEVEYATEE
jgi:type III secretion protein L